MTSQDQNQTQDQNHEEKFRVSLSLREIESFISYLKADTEEILSNAILIRRLEKQAKKIRVGLLESAYSAQSGLLPSFSPALKEAVSIRGQKLRDAFLEITSSEGELSHQQEEELATFLADSVPSSEQSQEEKDLITKVMHRKIFG